MSDNMSDNCECGKVNLVLPGAGWEDDVLPYLFIGDIKHAKDKCELELPPQ